MNFDEILTQLGEFGLWQKRSSLLLFLPYCGAGINVLIAAFAVMAPRHGYRCRNSCDGEQFDWNMPGYQLSDVFPSFDNTSSFYDPDNPDYCKFYKAINSSQGCNFHHSLPVLFSSRHIPKINTSSSSCCNCSATTMQKLISRSVSGCRCRQIANTIGASVTLGITFETLC